MYDMTLDIAEDVTLIWHHYVLVGILRRVDSVLGNECQLFLGSSRLPGLHTHSIDLLVVNQLPVFIEAARSDRDVGVLPEKRAAVQSKVREYLANAEPERVGGTFDERGRYENEERNMKRHKRGRVWSSKRSVELGDQQSLQNKTRAHDIMRISNESNDVVIAPNILRLKNR